LSGLISDLSAHSITPSTTDVIVVTNDAEIIETDNVTLEDTSLQSLSITQRASILLPDDKTISLNGTETEWISIHKAQNITPRVPLFLADSFTTVHECIMHHDTFNTGWAANVEGSDAVLFVSGAGDIRVTNCLMYNVDTGASARVTGSIGSSSVVTNNTMYHIYAGVNFFYHTAATVKNNIIHGGGLSTIVGISSNNGNGQTMDENANDIFDFSLPYYLVTVGPKSISTDPMFINPSSENFKLQIGSPCIDTGVDESADYTIPTIDILGTVRPQGSHTDIGAFEAYPIANFINGTPTLNRVTYNSVSFNVEIDQNLGKAVVGVYLSGKPAPNSTQVVNTVDGVNAPGIDGNNTTLSANVPTTFSSNPALTPTTGYDAYLITENVDDTLLSSSPVKISFTTTAVYYVDLSLGTTGVGNGTSGNPWSWSDFEALSPLPGGSTVLMKGQADSLLTGIRVQGFVNVIVNKWQSDPWRLRLDAHGGAAAFYDSISMNNGILDVHDTSSNDVYIGPNSTGFMTNMIYINEDTGGRFVSQPNGALTGFKGCTVLVKNLLVNSNPTNNMFFQDCIFGNLISIQNASVDTTFNHCVFNCPQADITGSNPVDTSSQFGWAQPTWPAWNADKTAWSDSTISIGILSGAGNPEPGNPPYTDYTSDPWSNPRMAIGADYMGIVANFTSDKTSGTAPLTVQFTDLSIENPDTWAWNFGDSSSSTAKNPSHTYGGGTFSVSLTASNSGSSTDTNTITKTNYITAFLPPSISVQPVSLIKTGGQSASFSVTASGTAPLDYQWKKDSTNITDATFSSYSIASVSSSDAGSYLVTVHNPYGSVDSSSATLTVNMPPSISVQPVSLTKMVGQSASFSVTASGTAPLDYQWKKDSTNITDATFSSYSIASVASSDAGSYLVTVHNPYGSIDSSSATLTIQTSSTTVFNPAISYLIGSANVAVEIPSGKVRVLTSAGLTFVEPWNIVS
jgi:hypothetical protein